MTIDGTNGDDILTGTYFTETINGFDGDDIIHGRGLADILNGGSGNDTFLYRGRLDAGGIINGGTGYDTLLLDGSGEFNFRAASISSIEEVRFLDSEYPSFVAFNSSQLGSGLSLSATIVGSATPNGLKIYVNTPSVDLSGLNFQNWDGMRYPVEIWANASDLSITGSDVDDWILGSSGDDVLRGGEGNDTLQSWGNSLGVDSLYGEAGDDTFSYYSLGEGVAGAIIDGGTGNDLLSIRAGGECDFRTATLRSIEEIEYGGDRTAGTMIINSSQVGGGGLSTNATIQVYQTLYYAREFQVYVDTASTDLSGLTFTNWVETGIIIGVFGTSGSDTVLGTSVDATIHGYGGDDILRGFIGDDQLFGGTGNDTLSDSSGTNTLVGGRGNDTITGGTGVDTIYGNIGADWLFGNDGDDIIFAGGWSDRVYGGDGDETIHGNRGNDRLFGDSGNDTMTGGHGRDFIDGGSGNDQIHGNGFADVLYGGSGDDFIFGGRGSDYINGGAGNDYLWGNGDGRIEFDSTDRFVFDSTFGNDWILDFRDGRGKIDFSGNATFNDFATVSANATQSGRDVLITQDAGNTLTIEDMNLADLDASDFIF